MPGVETCKRLRYLTLHGRQRNRPSHLAIPTRGRHNSADTAPVFRVRLATHEAIGLKSINQLRHVGSYAIQSARYLTQAQRFAGLYQDREDVELGQR